jgi:hypothetical protein
MKHDNNSFKHLTIKVLERHCQPNFVYVGHPIKKVLEKNDQDLLSLTTTFVESIACVLKKYGYTPLIPSLLGHNVNRQLNFDTKDVYFNCAKATRASCLFIALPLDDSIGLGMEYQIAIANHIPIVALINKKEAVTGMINKNFAKVLPYNCFEQALILLDKHLEARCYYENFHYYDFSIK